MVREEIYCPLIAFQAWRLFHLISTVTQATEPHPVIALTNTVLWATVCFTKRGGQAGSPAQLASPGAAPTLFRPQPWGGSGMRVVFSFVYICSCSEPGAAATATAGKMVRCAGGWCLAKAY